MGLDLAELVLDVEDMFEVSIPEEVLLKIETPKQLIDWLYETLSLRSKTTKSLNICITQRAFFLLRNQLTQQGLASRKEIRPSTNLSASAPAIIS